MGKFLKRLSTAFRHSLFRLRQVEPERKMGGLHSSILMDLYKSRIVENALNVGDKLPIEVLQNCFGETLNLSELMQKGPLVLKFHRGTWCNFCKADLQYYQKFHSELLAHNATAIAISTELPEKAKEIIEASGFSFHMVSDPTTQVAQQFGLLFGISPQLIDAVMDNYGIDLVRYYGKAEIEVALPATYVIGQDGVVLYAFLDEDFRNRANIEEVLHFVRKAAHLNRKRYQERCEERSCVVRDFVKAGCKRVCRHKSSFFHRRGKSTSSSASSSSSKRRASVPPSESESASITSSEYDRDPLRYCLQNETFLESFKSYLDKTYCTENLLFFLEAQQFLELEDSERQSNAARIFDTFIKTGSDLEINVDDTTREKITLSLKKGDVNPEIFAMANKEIYHLMESDSFLKWKKTKEFHRIWEQNGSLEFLSPLPSFAATAA